MNKVDIYKKLELIQTEVNFEYWTTAKALVASLLEELNTDPEYTSQKGRE